MELYEFEQAVLKLAFETESRITTASVAYYLGIPSREANRLLNLLLEEGTLELDSDENGNLFYRLPQAEAKDKTIADLKNQPLPQPVQRPSKNVMTTLDDDEGAPAVSLGRPPQGAPQGATSLPPSMLKRTPAPQARASNDQWGGFDDYYGATAATPQSDGAAGRRQMAASVVPAWTAVSTRSGSTDGTVGKTISNRYLVAKEARCEPQPLPAQRAVLVSCQDPVPSTGNHHDEQESWFVPRQDSTALVPAGTTALSTDVEQPEHQPGMALLLSLILCGTGQMYNGEVSKGIMMMVLCFLLWFVLLGWVVHIWSIVDAVVVAERLNRQQR